MAVKDGIGVAIARAVPPPDKLKRYESGGSGGSAPADDDGDEPEGEEDDKSVNVGLMQDFVDALGLKGADAEAACDALERYLDSVGYRRG